MWTIVQCIIIFQAMAVNCQTCSFWKFISQKRSIQNKREMNEMLEKCIHRTCVFYHVICERLGGNIYICMLMTNPVIVYVISLFRPRTVSVSKVKCFFLLYVKYQEKRREAWTCSLPQRLYTFQNIPFHQTGKEESLIWKMIQMLNCF